MTKKATCSNCFSTNVYGMSRVVGYYSIIENWNDSKQAELSDRQKGKYKFSEVKEAEIKLPIEEKSVIIEQIQA